MPLFKREFINSILIILGILSAGFGLKGFLLPNKFIDGGVTGISLLLAGLTDFSLSILILFLNIPFIILGFSQVSRNFGIKTIFAVAGLSIFLSILPYPIITSDKLLVALFGGFFLGAGIGLAIRGGGVLDGTEVLALYASKNFRVSVGDFIFIINVIIFSLGAILLSVETSLYSILTYLSASKTADFIIEGIEEYIGVTIISKRSEEIRQMIINQLGRGVTIYKGKRGYVKDVQNLDEIDIVYTVITRLEIPRLNNEIEKIDPRAFVIMNSIKDIKGGVIKKRPLKN